MARSSETNKSHPMEKLTPTFGVLVSSTKSWVWDCWWARKTSQCFKMANGSSCYGLIQPPSKEPSEWLKVHHLPIYELFPLPFCLPHYSSCPLSLFCSSPFPTFSVDLLLTKDRSLLITLRGSVKFMILLHKVWEKHPYHRNYLGFYTLDSHLLSPSVHGLLGIIWHTCYKEDCVVCFIFIII